MTLHNIPEGMAGGLSPRSLVAKEGGSAMLTSRPGSWHLGIGIQNFPEGAVVVPAPAQEGTPTWKAFIYGSLSGIVEPIFGVLTVFAAGSVVGVMPWLLPSAGP